MEVRSVRRDGVPLAPVEALITLEKSSFGLGPFRKRIMRDAAGRYEPIDFFLPMGGVWVVRLDMVVSDYEKITLQNALLIEPA